MLELRVRSSGIQQKQLIFLHVYHHIITLWLCWVCLQERLSIQWYGNRAGDWSAPCLHRLSAHRATSFLPLRRLCTIANAAIHVAMYYFYACQAIGLDVWWKRYLTTMQIVQFIADESGNVMWAYYTKYLGRACSGSWFSFWFGMGVIASFLLLFIDFYRKSYLKPKAGKAAAAKAE